MENSLLLTDLCSRLPYGIKCEHFGEIKEVLGVFNDIIQVGYDINDYEDTYIEDIKPYLRPLSSITEEEKNELKENNIKLDVCSNSEYIAYQWSCSVWEQDPLGNEDMLFLHHWFYKHFFDINDLIPKGLALEAPKGMYGD